MFPTITDRSCIIGKDRSCISLLYFGTKTISSLFLSDEFHKTYKTNYKCKMTITRNNLVEKVNRLV